MTLKNLSIRFGFLLAISMMAFSLALSPVSANHSGEEGEESHSETAHHDEDHDDDAVAVTTSANMTRAEQMEELINLLTQLVDLLKHQLEHEAADHS